MRNLVIAKRYAKALFNLALEQKQVEQFGQELDSFLGLLRDFPDLADRLQNPLYPEAARKGLFAMVADKASMTPIMRSYVNLLIEKRRVAHLNEISEYYHKLIDEYANVARARVKAASKLDAGAIQEIARSLEAITGKKIIVEFEQDKNLIGGVIAQIGDLVLDGSVKRQLLNFKETMKRGALG